MPEKYPVTLVRAGFLDSPLMERVSASTVPLVPIRSMVGNTDQYGAFVQDNPHYLLMVSQQRDRIRNTYGSNLALTVTSRSHTKNEAVARRFLQETGLDLSLSVPEAVRSMYQGIAMAFLVLEKKPEQAMAVLRR